VPGCSLGRSSWRLRAGATFLLACFSFVIVWRLRPSAGAGGTVVEDVALFFFVLYGFCMASPASGRGGWLGFFL
jgi:hypothetical protein